MRILLDTNVVLSGVLFGGKPRALLRQALTGDFDLVTSPALVRELEDLLERKFGFTPELARTTASEYESLADIVIPTVIPDVCRDPDDNQVPAAAQAGGAEAIVTGDKDLLILGKYRGIPILSPADFPPEPDARTSTEQD